jgi:hypothetical protein
MAERREERWERGVFAWRVASLLEVSQGSRYLSSRRSLMALAIKLQAGEV